MVCGKSWHASTVPHIFLPSSTSPMKVSKVKRSTMGHCQAASPSPKASSSRDGSWPPHCSPSSLASCSVRLKGPARWHLHLSLNWQQSVWHLLAQMKTIEELITKLLFTDSCALLAHMEGALQHILNLSLMQPRTLASPSAWRRPRCWTNPLHRRTVLLTSASMAPA